MKPVIFILAAAVIGCVTLAALCSCQKPETPEFIPAKQWESVSDSSGNKYVATIYDPSAVHEVVKALRDMADGFDDITERIKFYHRFDETLDEREARLMLIADRESRSAFARSVLAKWEGLEK